MKTDEKNPYTEVGRVITRSEIEKAAARAWEVPVENIYSRRRYPELVEPRYAVFNYRFSYMKQPTRHIVEGTPFNRAAVNHAEKKVNEWLYSDPVFRKKHEHFLNLLNEKVNHSDN